MIIRGLLLPFFLASLQVISANTFLCTENALIAPSRECNQYYICVNGEYVLQECPDNLHFDPVFKKCDSPERVGCNHNSINSDKHSNFFKRHNKTKENYSKDKHSKEKHNKEKHGKNKHSRDKYNKDRKFKEKYIKKIYCKEKYNKKRDFNEIPENNSDEKPEIHLTSSTIEYSETTSTQYPTEETSNIYNFSTTTDVEIMTQYTTIGETTNLTTESSTIMDSNTSTTETESTSSIFTGIATTPESNTSENSTSENNLHKCKSNNPGEVAFAPHSDCDKYYVCEGNSLIEMSCPAGLHFNSVLNVCDYPENANCLGTTTSQWTVATEEATSLSSETAKTVETETTHTPIPQCRANKPGEVEFAPHPDCGKYYVCERDRLIEMTCPAGLHFNTILNVCDYPENANCVGTTTLQWFETTKLSTLNSTETVKTTETTHTPIGQCKSNRPGEIVLAPHPDCHKYYVCKGDRLIEKSCPPELYFNPVLNICDYLVYENCKGNVSTAGPVFTEENTSTIEPTISGEPINSDKPFPSSTEDMEMTHKPNNNCRANNPGEVEFAPHPDCGKYYVCEDDKRIEMMCPVGLHFNPSLNICDYPENVKCIGNAVSKAPVTPKESTSSNTESSITNGQSGQCRANKPGELAFAPHPDCNNYYFCEGDSLIEMNCPVGLHFNPDLNICDYPENASCERTTNFNVSVTIESTSNSSKNLKE